jgi:hypothetical protein
VTPATRRSAASIRARLLARAHREGVQFQRILTRYASERLLYRLSVSPATDRFILKGALLFDLWYDSGSRPTRDIDLSGQGDPDMPDLIRVFSGLCALEVDDGIIFDAASVDASPIRDRARYHGASLTLDGFLDGARCKVKVDIGFGDVVTPAPETAVFPTLLEDLPSATLRVYPRYTVVAEKLEAIISFGMVNSRMKDYFDLWVIMKDQALDRSTLSQAVGATLRRRGTPYPDDLPVGLAPAFAESPLKQSQWSTFLSRNHLQAPALPVIVALLRDSLGYLFDGAEHSPPLNPSPAPSDRCR